MKREGKGVESNEFFKEPRIKAYLAERSVKATFPNRDLVEYNANLWLRKIIEELDVELMSSPFKNKNILGHSMIDELGASIMINDNIGDINRKNFTIAHEVGHHIMHKSTLKLGGLYDLEGDLDNDLNLRPLEAQANVYAASVLLPYDVLEAQIVTDYTIYDIRRSSGISVDAIRYRVIDFLYFYFHIDTASALLIIEEYKNCHSKSQVHNSTLRDLIYSSTPITKKFYTTSKSNDSIERINTLKTILKKHQIYDLLQDSEKKKAFWSTN